MRKELILHDMWKKSVICVLSDESFEVWPEVQAFGFKNDISERTLQCLNGQTCLNVHVFGVHGKGGSFVKYFLCCWSTAHFTFFTFNI